MAPRARSASKQLSGEDLSYLAGIWEATNGLRGVGTGAAVAISDTEAWPKAMAEKYGGSHEQFTSTKGKQYWGWYVPIKRRLEIAEQVRDHTIATDQERYDKVWAKLSRAANNSEYSE